MELNCITFPSAKATQSFPRLTATTICHLYRSRWAVMSGLSGSNLMIRKQLRHSGHETSDCGAILASSRRNSMGNTVMRVTSDRRTTDEEALIEDVAETMEKVEYNWTEEWYPMYLTAEMPSNAPLGLTVFDKSLVLFYDGQGKLNCLEDRCPHRSAKLSEGQITHGNLECLYHGWQFDGAGSCIKIPQLAPGAKVPKAACAHSYEVRESQGVIWVWLSEKTTGDPMKLPWFEHYEREGFQEISSIHELPYDYSILLENIMDPAHVPISHDQTDSTSKRENAQALVFEVTERTSRGFAGKWGEISSPTLANTIRFEAPCCFRNDMERVGKDGKKGYFSGVFLCCPAGQGKSRLLVRFGGTIFGNRLKLMPPWIIHRTSNVFLEQDMGILASQNETLVRENVGTKHLYLNLKSSDTWVTEYRKWLDLTGHGMPYYFGHRSLLQPSNMTVAEAAPAGLVAAAASSYPARGSFGALFARDPTNRYSRHVVHCKSCQCALGNFRKFRKIGVALGALSTGVAIMLSSVAWRATFAMLALLMFAGAYACTQGIASITQNFVRAHRR